MYWAYWKRGWWAWLMLVCVNIGLAAVYWPLSYVFGDQGLRAWLVLVAAWLVVGAPFFGWVFERFAATSQRIG